MNKSISNKKEDVKGKVVKLPIRYDPIQELNKKHAVIMLGGKCVVLNEGTNPVTGLPDVTFSSIHDFKNRYSNKFTTRNDGKNISIAKAWLESINRREYEGIVFSPGNEVENYFNLWRGFAIDPKPGDWSLYKAHILDVICCGNREHAQYVIAWMARIVQNPGGDKPGTSIVLRGKQGTGKGVLCSTFGRIFGPHFVHITNQKQLTGKFNSHLKESLVVFVDEGFWAGYRGDAGVLKALITEKTVMVEPKGKDAFAVKNHMNLFVASNNDWVVPATLEERRFLVLNVSDSRIRDYSYFQAIADQMDNGGLEGMLHELLRVNCSRINLRQIPRTDALLDQMINSMGPVAKFWFNLLAEGNVPEQEQTSLFYEDYTKFCNNQKLRYPGIHQQFGKKIHELCVNIKRVRTGSRRYRRYEYVFPSLEDCRKQFEEHLGMPVKWEVFTVTDDDDLD